MNPEHAKAAADLVATMWESEFPPEKMTEVLDSSDSSKCLARSS
jgi:hypothetical protein